ncbi:MAG: hypothetical protein EOO16_11420 [Chitinophagaceae bacterium]|nr:MAG: hypothetical protein EOO16_11420 [Chitinophagaceae bacterium]
MRKFYASLLSVLFGLGAAAQVSVTATAGTTTATSYTTLKGAFDAINAGTHRGVVTVAINGSTTETASAILNASGSGSASYTAVNISATTAATTITSNIAAATVQFNGADNVDFNGNGFLQVVNTNAAAPVVSFTNDATNNKLRSLRIKGATAIFTGTAAAPTITSGVVFFGTGTTTGNDNNLIDDCDIDGGGAAICLLFSSGTAPVQTTTTNVLFNSGNTVRNTGFHDFVNPAITGAIGITLRNSTSWTLRNNAMFFTTPVATARQFVITGYQALASFTNDFHVVANNRFGGSAFDGSGSASLTNNGGAVLGFIAFDIEVAGTGMRIDSNSVKNVALTYGAAAGSFANAGIFGFVGGFDGTQLIRDNTISDISVRNTAGTASFQAIHVNARTFANNADILPTFLIQRNTISNLSGNTTTAGDASFYGIRLESSSTTSPTSAGETLNGTAGANPTFFVDSNKISNFTTASTGVNSVFRGIATVNTQGAGSGAALFPWLIASNNSISNFSTGSAVSSYSTPVAVGIQFAGANITNTVDTAFIEKNTIFNLNATNTGDVGTVVAGILATNGLYSISGNRVYDLKNSASGTTARPAIMGISVRAAQGVTEVFNNFISIGASGGAVNHFGFINNFATTGPINFSYNSVWVGGTATGNDSSAAFIRGTENFAAGITTPVVLRNNILYNARTGGTGAHFGIANTSATPATGFTSANNTVFSATAANVALWGTTAQAIAAYATAASDANANSTAVTFANAATGDLHLSGASLTDISLKGAPIAGITTDIDSDTRSTTQPSRGADEGTACAVPVITAQPQQVDACENSAATFSVTATGTGLTYQWRKNGGNIVGATNATYTIGAAGMATAGSYDVVIGSTCGSVTSNAVQLVVNPLTNIGAQPVDQVSCVGGTASIGVGAGGVGLAYQWRKNGVNIPGATQSFINFNGITAADAAAYSVVVTGACGAAVTSNAATLTVQTPVAITSQPQSLTVCAGQPATFTVTATGPGVQYAWVRDNGTIILGTNATFTIPSAAAADAAQYHVAVYNTCGQVNSTPAILTVNTASNCTTAAPNLDADVTAMTLQPTLLRGSNLLVRVQSRRALRIDGTVTDANGRILQRFARTVSPGGNDLHLSLPGLPAGSYLLTGVTGKGRTETLRFVKQ